MSGHSNIQESRDAHEQTVVHLHFVKVSAQLPKCFSKFAFLIIPTLFERKQYNFVVLHTQFCEGTRPFIWHLT